MTLGRAAPDFRTAYGKELKFFYLVVENPRVADRLIDLLFSAEALEGLTALEVKKRIRGATKTLAVIRQAPVDMQKALANLFGAVTELVRVIAQFSHAGTDGSGDRWLKSFIGAFEWFWRIPESRQTLQLLIGSMGAVGIWHHQRPLSLEAYRDILKLKDE